MLIGHLPQFLPASAANPRIAGRTAGLHMSHEGPSPIPGYGIEDINWAIQTDSDRTVTITGDVQKVMQYAEENKIAFVEQQQQQQQQTETRKKDSLASRRPRAANNHLQSRDAATCGNPDRYYAWRKDIKIGIKHLRKVPGNPANGPGPWNCGRVSCAYNSSIWWCNDVCTYSLSDTGTFTTRLLLNKYGIH